MPALHTLLPALLLGSMLALLAGQAPAQTGAATHTGPDTALQGVFREIEANRLDAALDRTEALLKVYPNFRLAHLVKGDLLLARTRPLTTFGNVEGPGQQVEALREEAVARLRAYRERPATEFVPRYLMQMGPEQQYAVVVDAERARLYVYRNDNGRPRFVTDYYASHGKAGVEKWREGDNRTPLGVYHVTSFIDPKRLPDFYGSGAFPINYPNDWDKRLGRTGHGIWLHGTPSDTYARPPKASEGCVVLANQDFSSLSNYVQPGLTPVIISNEIEWLSVDDWQRNRRNLNDAIEAWRQDWESLDVERHLSHYAKDFRSDRLDRDAWASQARRIAKGQRALKVAIDKLSMFRNPGKDELVVVTFEQTLRGQGLADTQRKRQYWVREGGRWKIAYESAA
ncbi:MAG: L,D-transpeptidase family protein [Lysobacter sp.]|nr:L,D-transpeptidase family protein [Lysobacter sp.]